MASFSQLNQQNQENLSREAPFGWQFFGDQDHGQENPTFHPGHLHHDSVSSENVRTLVDRRRPTEYTHSSQEEYTASPEPVPHHQVLPSQKEIPTPGTSSPSNEAQSLSWGSDPAFGPAGYRPHPDTLTHKLMEDELTETYFNFVDFRVENRDTTDSDSPLPEVEVRKQESSAELDEVPPSSKRRLQHIVSERNRRTQQSKLYDEICRLVPGVSLKRCTKKEVLMRTADWLTVMVEGNQNLKQQLDYLRRYSSAQEML